ncbi:MAG: hypothetical protein GY725_23425 [bacterium]|nr:hypothetical protein [bacterium]
MSPWLWAVIGFSGGIGVMAAWGVLRRQRDARRARSPLPASELLRVVPDPIARPEPAARHASRGASGGIAGGGAECEATEVAPPHLITLLGQAIRGSLRQLRRCDGFSPEALAPLERIVWQTRMLVSRPRPMQAKPTSPISLLQEAAEEVPQLRDGIVGASWSLLNRQPAHVDPERMRAAFRELLVSGAEIAGKNGRMGIKILQGSEPGFPVRIEIEIGRRGTEPDPLTMLVTRHLIEAQGGRLEVDGNVTRILLRNAAPEVESSVA